MSKPKTQIEKDIAFCIDEMDMSNEQIGEMLRACEGLGNIGVEYFCEEFVFIPDSPEEMNRLHDDEYLSIAEFNALYWEGN
jgi:sugar phosphate isomerase/epimerase